MPTIISPPLLLDSAGQPANGTIFARATGTFMFGTDTITTAGGFGEVRDGALYQRGNGGAFFLPPTPTGFAFELVLVIEERYDGRNQKKVITRTVSVPDTATATWLTLVDVVPETTVNYILPAWITELQADLDAATSVNDLIVTDLADPASGSTFSTALSNTIDGKIVTERAVTATTIAATATPMAAADRPVGVALVAQWDARLRAYNLNNATLSKARAAHARALAGGNPLKLHMLGHSYLTGLQTATPYLKNTSSAIMTRLLNDAKVLGKVAEGHRVLSYGTAVGARLSDDPRFVVAPEWTYISGWGYAAASSYRNINNIGDISFTPDFPCTHMEVVYLDGPTTQPISFSVDGGTFSSSSITGGAATAVWKSRITSAALGTHTFTIRPPAAGDAQLLGFRAYDSSAPNAIEVTNGGVSGSTAAGTSVGSWTADIGTGYIPALPTIDYFKPELACILLGVNDRSAAFTETAYLDALTVVIQRVKSNGGDVILLREPMPTNDEYTRGLYQLADTLGVGLIETGLDWPKPYSASQAEPFAYIGADAGHPSARGHTAIARAVGNALLGVL